MRPADIILDVTAIPTLAALLALPLLLYLPGLLLERAVWHTRVPVQGLELAVMRVLASVLLSGWIGLTLAEWGAWSLARMAGCSLAFPLAIYLWRSRRRPPLTSPPLGFVAPAARVRILPTLRMRVGFDLALLLVALVFAVLVARPFEVVRGGLDAGVYALTGYSIAQTGGIERYDPVLAEIGQRARAGDPSAQHVMGQFLGVQDPVRYIATRLRLSGFFLSAADWQTGRVVPQFFHLWPVWIAMGAAVGGAHGGLLMTGAWALLGVLIAGLLGRRLVHPLVGVGGAGLLALNAVQVWFARMPVSEALAQGLTLAGLWAYSHFADEPDGTAGAWWGWLTGMAFGSLALARIDFFWAVGPALALLLYAALSHRWRLGHSVMALTLGLLLTHAALHVVFIARAYFFDTAYSPLGELSALLMKLSLPFMTEPMRRQLLSRPVSPLHDAWRLPLEITAVVGVGLLTLVLWRRPAPLLRAERWLALRRNHILLGIAALVCILAMYAYVVRPRIIDATLLRAPVAPASLSRLQGYIGAPVAVPTAMNVQQTVAQAQANFVRFGWYLSPLGILLGVVGAITWLRRGLDRRSWLFLLITAAYTLFYVRQLYGTGGATYIYILRRYVPMVYPAWSLLMAYALWTLWKGGRALAARRSLAVGLAAAMLLFLAFTGRNSFAHVEYGGAIAQFGELAQLVRPDDIVLVRGGGADVVEVRDTGDVVAGPLTYLYGRNALTFKGRDPMKYTDALADQVARWTGQGRTVYALIAASGGEWRLPGWRADPVSDWTWSFREFQQLRDQKPYTAGPGSISFRLYRMRRSDGVRQPTIVSPADTIAQVSGLHRAEGDGSQQFAWTTGEGIVRLDGPAGPSELHLTLSAGPRPRSLGDAEVCVDIAPETLPYPEAGREGLPWQSLGCHKVDRQVGELRLPLGMHPGAGTYLVRLTTAPWKPSRTAPDPGEPRSPDQRDLGVRWYAAGIVAQP